METIKTIKYGGYQTFNGKLIELYVKDTDIFKVVYVGVLCKL